MIPNSEYVGHLQRQKILNRYEFLAVKLEQYIANYSPRTFQEPIRIFDYAPSIHPADARKFVKWFIDGSLEEKIQKPENLLNSRIPKTWYFREAILDFFKENGHKFSK